MQHTVSASVPIRVARQNVYATLAIDVTNSLAQTWDDQLQSVTPNWDPNAGGDASKQPILTPVVNVPLAFSWVSVEWYRDGLFIGDAMNGALNTSMYDIDSNGVLRIKGNLASAGNTDPDSFLCDVWIRVNNLKYQMKRSTSATILPASSDGWAVVVSANHTALSSESGRTTCQLTCDAYCKGVLQPDSEVRYQWFRGGTALSGCTGKTLLVYRDHVDGSAANEDRNGVDWEQLYRVEVRDSNNKLQGIGSTKVTDQADNYCLAVTVSDDVTDSVPAVVSMQLRERKSAASEWQNFSQAATYVAKLFDVADDDNVTLSSGTLNSTGGGSFNVTAAQMDSAGIECGNIDIVANW